MLFNSLQSPGPQHKICGDRNQSSKQTCLTPGRSEGVLGLWIVLPACVEGRPIWNVSSIGAPLRGATHIEVLVPVSQGYYCDVCLKCSSFLFRSSPYSYFDLVPVCKYPPSSLPRVPAQISRQLSNHAPSPHPPRPNHHLAKLHTYIFSSFNLFSHKVLILHFSRVVWIWQNSLRLWRVELNYQKLNRSEQSITGWHILACVHLKNIFFFLWLLEEGGKKLSGKKKKGRKKEKEKKIHPGIHHPTTQPHNISDYHKLGD